MIDNPFTVLTAVVAPAILTNACSVLALGTSNRIARVVDRARAVTADLEQALPGTVQRDHHLAALARLQARSRLLLHALRAIYASLGLFAVSALISVVGALATYYALSVVVYVAATIAVAAGVTAVAGLVAGCSLMVAETRLALESVHHDLEQAMANRPI